MSSLPQWIEARLDERIRRDLRQRTVAEAVWESEDPYLSRTVIQQIVQEKTGRTFDKSTVIDRLTELVEQKVLKTDEVCGGQIYWIFDDDSDWPIPPDVKVEPTSDEMTVQEFFNSTPVIVGSVGVGAILVSSLFMWIGGYVSTRGQPLFGLESPEFIFAGFLLIFAGWVTLAVSIPLWFAKNPPIRR